jgi:EpsI family protein
MNGRRELLLGGLAVAALAASEALRPRRRFKLLQSGTIADRIPATIGPWVLEGVNGLVGADNPGQLERALYSEIVSRIYRNQESGAEIMLLAAYGDTQSDLLQLHRPEACYPAVGFNIASSQPYRLALPGGAVLPVRHVVATINDRTENILYWTRMGENIPQSGRDQRVARLENAFRGLVTDGILVRLSMLGDSQKAFQILDEFTPQMLEQIARPKRPALIGTRLSQQMT